MRTFNELCNSIMRWIITLLAVAMIVILSEIVSTRHLKSSHNLNRRRFNKFWDNDGDEEFKERRKYQRRYGERKYTRLMLSRKMFYYWTSNYDNWTNWTACSPRNCTKSRYRKCKDNSWEENVIDFRLQKKCPVKFIFEKMTCDDIPECVKSNFSKLGNVSTLPKICGRRPMEIQNKIYGGDDAGKNSWPWHVGLYVIHRNRAIYICGGTLINPGWVITTAHCLKTKDKVSTLEFGKLIDTRKNDLYDSFHVIIGDHDRSTTSDNEMTRKLSHFIIHPSFRANYTSNLYDVALLKLDSPVPSNVGMSFPCVPQKKNYTMDESAKCFAVGWGDVEPNNPYNIWSFEFDYFLERWRKNRRTPRKSSILQEVEIPLVDFEKCKRQYRIFNLNKDIHMCAGSKLKDTCRGDSGGGLFCLDPKTNSWQLYGITNFGSARGCGMSYGVYIRVSEVSMWITEILKSSTNEKN